MHASLSGIPWWTTDVGGCARARTSTSTSTSSRYTSARPSASIGRGGDGGGCGTCNDCSSSIRAIPAPLLPA